MDAEWQTQPGGTVWEEYDSTWETIRWDDGHDVHDLFVNDVGVQWLGSSDGINWSEHTFSPDHVYRLYLVGTGNRVKFHVADHVPIEPANCYGDNSGTLMVSIEPVPEPPALSGFISGIAFLSSAALRKQGAKRRCMWFKLINAAASTNKLKH
jgi:hypothetical protein